MGGGDPHSLSRITFRIKDPNRPASDFGMKWICKDTPNRTGEGVVFWTEGINRIWYDRYFTSNACNFCDDIFAELADASFMDAWLSPYRNDNRGHTIMLIRNKDLLDLKENPASENTLQTSHISINQVIISQNSVIFEKRKAILERLIRYDKKGLSVPTKRISQKSKLRYDQRFETDTKFRISRKSPMKWINSGKDIKRFRKNMKWPMMRLKGKLEDSKQ